ncbi:bifunctional riboflavin kinase/FAD synthetase [Bacillus marinisedimentorum]|uniref:bifunctional riboflavin kinase/FAD synthetase n=1 Tax=Bacillus marinisedimentorum TaxID=1821260 RepID=UPI0007DF2AF4|nr:bifunctional riboflavin kinase/FAD synthetase [Bacillus marinisedimentorum]
MKTIKLKYPLKGNDQESQQKVMALGFFDGVHRGHKKVIQTAVNKAAEAGMESAVMTFHPHPSAVLRKSVEHVRYITPPHEKEKEISKLGVDVLYVVEFSHSFADLQPQEFVDEYIIGLNVKHVVAGFDYSYGRFGKGTMETMPFHSRGQFTQTVVGRVAEEDEKVSSTLIRGCLKDGAVAAVAHYLGRPYRTIGNVGHGDRRGRTIGFPTANLELEEDYLIPAPGVYAVKATVGGKTFDGVANIGFKPTFNEVTGAEPSIEVHLFNFNQNIYGDKMEVDWYKRLRPEQKFPSADALVTQIEADKAASEAFFAARNVSSR